MNFSVSARARDRQAYLVPGSLSTRQPAERQHRGVRHSEGGVGFLLQSEAWVTVRTALLQAVRPFPEAREAMIAAIQQSLGRDEEGAICHGR